MPIDNQSGSMGDVVESIGPVLSTFINEVIRGEMPDCRYVYDPELSYESGLARLRSNNQMNDLKGKTENQPLPLFIFRRTALMYPEEYQAPNMRSTSGSGFMKTDEGVAVKYAFAHAEFSIDFMYANPNIEEVSRFEIAYMSRRGITGTTEFVVNLPGLGDFKYFINWNEVIDVDVQSENNYFKAVASTLKIRGFFFVFESEAKQILEIKNNIKTFHESVGMVVTDEILKAGVIVPT